MKKMIFILILLLCFNAFAECDEQGYFDCGTTGDVKWYISNDKKTLTVTGNGEMADYGYTSNTYFDVNNIKSVPECTTAPWGQYNNLIETININSGVTSIGAAAFVGMEHVTNVNLPDGLQNIRDTAFDQMSALESLTIPDSVNKVGYAAFAWTSSLKKLDIGDGFTQLSEPSPNKGKWEQAMFAYMGQIVPQHPDAYQAGLDANAIIYCDTKVSGACEQIKNTYLLNNYLLDNFVTYSKEGDRYVLEGQKYKSLSDYEKGNPIKRIYTIDEANQVTGKTNTFSIRYR